MICISVPCKRSEASKDKIRDADGQKNIRRFLITRECLQIYLFLWKYFNRRIEGDHCIILGKKTMKICDHSGEVLLLVFALTSCIEFKFNV